MENEAFYRKRIRELRQSMKRLGETQDRYLESLRHAPAGSYEEERIGDIVQDIGERIEIEDGLLKKYYEALDALVVTQVRGAGVRIGRNPRPHRRYTS